MFVCRPTHVSTTAALRLDVPDPFPTPMPALQPQQDHGWGDQFFFNHTNPAAAAFFVESVVASLADAATDGTFTDDVSGVPQEHPLVQSRINMTDAELAALQYATQATSQELINAAVLAGKYNWQGEAR